MPPTLINRKRRKDQIMKATKKLPSHVQTKVVKGRTYYYFVLPRDGSRNPKYVALPDAGHESFMPEWRRLNGMYPRARKPTHWEDQPSLIYFIGTDRSEIKIGRAVNPEARLVTLQAGNASELRLLATTPGDCAEERAYHDRFADTHIRGEWFAASPALLAEIEALQKAALQPTEEEILLRELGFI
jgi:hypothetical protein